MTPATLRGRYFDPGNKVPPLLPVKVKKKEPAPQLPPLLIVSNAPARADKEDRLESAKASE